MPNRTNPHKMPSPIPTPIRGFLAALVVLTVLAPPTVRAQELFREVPGAHLFSG